MKQTENSISIDALVQSSTFGVMSTAFAKAFAVYTVEVWTAMKDRQEHSWTRGPESAEKTDALSSEARKEMPQWVQEEYARSLAAPPTAMVEMDMEAAWANLIRSRLLFALDEKRLSQSELAKRMHKSASAVSRILRDPTRCRLETLQDMAEALDVDLSDLARPSDDARTPRHGARPRVGAEQSPGDAAALRRRRGSAA